MQPFRQHVLQPQASRIGALAHDAPQRPRVHARMVIEPDDAAFGDCHSKDIACQLAQHGLGEELLDWHTRGCSLDYSAGSIRRAPIRPHWKGRLKPCMS